MKTKLYLPILLIATLVSFILIGCDDNDPVKIIPPVEIDRSEMFGLAGATPRGNGIGGGSENKEGSTPEMVANLCGALGLKAHRTEMYLHWALEFSDAGELKTIEESISGYKHFISLLREQGVEKIILSSPSFMYPYGNSRTYWKSIPEPGTELYIEFLELVEDCYKLLAETFPDIDYFEVGNEMNAPNGINISKNGFNGSASVEENAPYIFSNSEIAYIMADIFYYANKGIKSVNSNGKVITSGLYVSDKEEARRHLNFMYEYIKSGNSPSTRVENNQRELTVSTNPGDYFEYLNWHPYIHAEHTIEWLKYNKSLYEVAVNHDDKNRKIMITEFGYFDSYLESREETIADVCVPAIVALTNELPTIETLFTFRLFNDIKSSILAEQTYGIFDSPLQDRGARPKPVALSLFFHYNGVDADPDPLYQYMK